MYAEGPTLRNNSIVDEKMCDLIEDIKNIYRI